MSKRICKNCGSIDIRTSKYSNGGKFYVCNDCFRVGLSDVFPEYTVFHKITASPEVLAPYFVRADFDEPFLPWFSTLTNKSFKTYEDALAATVAKLKEVEK